MQRHDERVCPLRRVGLRHVKPEPTPLPAFGIETHDAGILAGGRKELARQVAIRPQRRIEKEQIYGLKDAGKAI